MTLVVHIIAGSLGLVSGFVALYASKGTPLHRRAGLVFVCVVLTMSFTGLMIAAVRGVSPALNIPIALLTGYLVITSLTTMRPPAAGSRSLTIGLLLVAFGVGVADLTFGFQAVARGGKEAGIAFPSFIFGLVGLLGAAGDVRVVRSGPLRGAPRIARHLWRMCFALAIAALSFFVGQAKVIPEPIRIMPLLALPVLAVLATMFYWLWRVRIRRNFRGVARAGISQPVRTHS